MEVYPIRIFGKHSSSTTYEVSVKPQECTLVFQIQQICQLIVENVKYQGKLKRNNLRILTIHKHKAT